MSEEEAYSGLLGAYRFAFRESDSWTLRSYVLASALVGVFVSVLLALALVTWIANPTGRVGERALLGVVALFVLVPLAAPVLIAARRHRFGRAGGHADVALALAGYGFVASLYLALFISDPRAHSLSGPLAAVAAALDGLPDAYGVLPPVLAVVVLGAIAWATRSQGTKP